MNTSQAQALQNAIRHVIKSSRSVSEAQLQTLAELDSSQQHSSTPTAAEKQPFLINANQEALHQLASSLSSILSHRLALGYNTLQILQLIPLPQHLHQIMLHEKDATAALEAILTLPQGTTQISFLFEKLMAMRELLRSEGFYNLPSPDEQSDSAEPSQTPDLPLPLSEDFLHNVIQLLKQLETLRFVNLDHDDHIVPFHNSTSSSQPNSSSKNTPSKDASSAQPTKQKSSKKSSRKKKKKRRRRIVDFAGDQVTVRETTTTDKKRRSVHAATPQELKQINDSLNAHHDTSKKQTSQSTDSNTEDSSQQSPNPDSGTSTSTVKPVTRRKSRMSFFQSLKTLSVPSNKSSDAASSSPASSSTVPADGEVYTPNSVVSLQPASNQFASDLDSESTAETRENLQNQTSDQQIHESNQHRASSSPQDQSSTSPSDQPLLESKKQESLQSAPIPPEADSVSHRIVNTDHELPPLTEQQLGDITESVRTMLDRVSVQIQQQQESSPIEQVSAQQEEDSKEEEVPPLVQDSDSAESSTQELESPVNDQIDEVQQEEDVSVALDETELFQIAQTVDAVLSKVTSLHSENGIVVSERAPLQPENQEEQPQEFESPSVPQTVPLSPVSRQEIADAVKDILENVHVTTQMETTINSSPQEFTSTKQLLPSQPVSETDNMEQKNTNDQQLSTTSNTQDSSSLSESLHVGVESSPSKKQTQEDRIQDEKSTSSSPIHQQGVPLVITKQHEQPSEISATPRKESIMSVPLSPISLPTSVSQLDQLDDSSSSSVSISQNTPPTKKQLDHYLCVCKASSDTPTSLERFERTEEQHSDASNEHGLLFSMPKDLLHTVFEQAVALENDKSLSATLGERLTRQQKMALFAPLNFKALMTQDLSELNASTRIRLENHTKRMWVIYSRLFSQARSHGEATPENLFIAQHMMRLCQLELPEEVFSEASTDWHSLINLSARINDWNHSLLEKERTLFKQLKSTVSSRSYSEHTMDFGSCSPDAYYESDHLMSKSVEARDKVVDQLLHYSYSPNMVQKLMGNEGSDVRHEKVANAVDIDSLLNTSDANSLIRTNSQNEHSIQELNEGSSLSEEVEPAHRRQQQVDRSTKQSSAAKQRTKQRSGAHSQHVSQHLKLIVQPQPAKFSRTKLRLEQNGMCAGCGKNLKDDYGMWRKKDRLCYYTKKLYCRSCHSNEKMLIPARVIHAWDFKRYHVSNAAFEYLKEIQSTPCLCVSAINPALFDQVLNLRKARKIRSLLMKQWDIVKECPMAPSVTSKLHLDYRTFHYVKDTEMYSMNNLEDLQKPMRSSNFLRRLATCFHKFNSHIVDECRICLSRAKEHCAACSRPDALFRFQLQNATECPQCGNLFHTSCFRNPVTKQRECPVCSGRR